MVMVISSRGRDFMRTRILLPLPLSNNPCIGIGIYANVRASQYFFSLVRLS
jgi:hypothetical protein